MQKLLKVFLFIAIAFLAVPIATPQSITQPVLKTSLGISEVTKIEELAASFKATKESIASRKLELAELEKALKAKADKLRAELDALIKERDALLRDLKGGFFCSKCGKAKSEFEKEGKSFEQHLDEVTGVPIPAPTTRIEQVREEYKLKIAYKKVQIQNLEKNDPAVNSKRKEIADLEKKLTSICEEMTRRSKSYEKILEGQTKDKQLAWIRDLMDYASDILIAEDRIVINEARIAALTKEFERRSAEARDEIENKNLEQREIRKNRIAEIERLKYDSDIKLKELVDPLDASKTDLSARISEIESKLKIIGLPADEKQALTAEKNSLTAQLAQIDSEIRTHTANHAKANTALDQEKRRLDAEITKLIADLPKQQDAEVAKLKVDYDKRKADARAAAMAANSDLVKARAAYKEREAFYSKENSAFFDVVAGESNRIVIAGRDGGGCPVANEARQFVAGNWNKLLPCVSSATTRAKPYSTNVFGSYCPKEVAASAFGKYKSFLRGLNAEDTSAVKANSNEGWYEALFAAPK